ncbi:MAG: NAD(P)H-dependent glycerol-3-phosphate dehydrogenase [Luteitalea sp.]|nr:NAD(P)H-dependent glycerol-3-phosphate dehydrogenase [Luteitalea sp.]
MSTIAVIGAGSWGTAFALHLARLGHSVRLWARDPALATDMARRRANAVYLPDLILPDGVTAVGRLGEALSNASFVVCTVPSHGVRVVFRAAAPRLATNAVLVSGTKGLETGSLLRVSEVIRDEVGAAHAVVVLSGPSFAAEVARGLPAAVCVASDDSAAVERVQAEFRGPGLRLYASTDVVGVEIGGALKNVIAIAAGVVEGLGLGANAMAALITRGLVEISRLACALGGRRETLAGLSGLGDLVLTCTGELSRNHHVGVELGKGRPLTDILAEMKMVAEGVNTTVAAVELGVRHGVELPIASQMADVLAGRKPARLAVEELMARPQRNEME